MLFWRLVMLILGYICSFIGFIVGPVTVLYMLIKDKEKSKHNLILACYAAFIAIGLAGAAMIA